MDMSLGKNIKRRRLAAGFKTLQSFADAIEWDAGNLSRLENDKQGYSDERLRIIAAKLGCSVADLFAEDEAAQIRLDAPASGEKISPENKSPVTDNWDGVDRRKNAIPTEPNIGVHDSVEDLDPERYLQVESFDVKLSAGSGNIEWVPSRGDPVTFRAGWFAFKKLKPKTCKLVYVRGSSMEPILSDGDAVLIDTAQTSVIDGEIYAVLYWDALYIKTLYRIPGGIQLKSENSEHPSFDVRGEDLEHLTILGRKVWRGG